MNKTEDGLYLQKGYLDEDFLFFHLKDCKAPCVETHYHAFHKLVVFYKGDVTYCIEGKYYKLRAGDILFIPNHALHKPIISGLVPYERAILWINPELSFMKEPLLQCFEPLKEERSHLLRFSVEQSKHFEYLINLLGNSITDTSFGHKSLRQSAFTQLLVWLNRYFQYSLPLWASSDIEYDARIQTLLTYIQEHLQEDLSINMLSKKMYLSKHYLMHFFKAQTGYSLHQYIQKKRLIKASLLIKQGHPVSSICECCGFGDYSSFARAFKKEFGCSPRNYKLQYPSPLQNR